MKYLERMLILLSFPIISSITTPKYLLKDTHTVEDLLNSEAFKTTCNEVNKVKYLSDVARYGEDYIQSSKETELYLTGDCDDRAPYLARKLKKAGYDVSLNIGYRDEKANDSITHMWANYKNHVIDIFDYIDKDGDTIPKVRVLNREDLNSNQYKRINVPRKYKKKFRKAQKNEDVFLEIK